MDLLINTLGDRVTAEEIMLIENSLYLIIALPIVTTLTGFFRHIIGLKSLSVYAPIILTFTFYQLGYIDTEGINSYFRGLQFGLLLYAVVFAVGSATYLILKRVRMHYIPKTTLVMTSVSVSVVALIILGTLLFDKKGFLYMDIFPLIMIVTLSDTFSSSLSRKSFKYTSIVGLQTLFIGLAAYTIISINGIRQFTLDYPILIILFIVLLNFYIGKFVGLRLTEYYRFRELLNTDSDDKPRKNKKK